MKKCEQYSQMISLFIDNELTQKEREDFLNHISTCSNCKSELEKIQYIVGEINNVPTVDIPNNLHNEIMDKVRKEKRISVSWQRYSLIAAAFICVFVIVNTFEIRKGDEPMARSAPRVASLEEEVFDSITIKKNDYDEQVNFYKDYCNKNNLEAVIDDNKIYITGKYENIYNLLGEIQLREETLSDNFSYYEEGDICTLTLILG